MPHLIYILFLFALGACVGSFLNVVVWRLPRDESLITPPSHCPKCNALLRWYDNIPVFGWIKLRGRCRYCKELISARYPIVEAIAGLIFVLYYVLFFVVQVGPCAGIRVDAEGQAHLMHPRPLSIADDWLLYGLCMFLLMALLCSSLIDAELFIIPIEIPWLVTGIALLVHALNDTPISPGNLTATPLQGALAAGAGLGVLISYLLWVRGIMPASFAEGGPLLEVDREEFDRQTKAARRAGKEPPPEPREFTSSEVRREMRKEMLFLLPALVLGFLFVLLAWKVGPISRAWSGVMRVQWISALLGTILGGLVGGFVVWITRILGTLGFGREAMGMGDVHLMVAVGAVLGPGPATVAFFLAPFFGIAVAIYMLLTGTKRELPYGPYLSLATAFVMLFYCPIAAYLAPGISNVMWLIGHSLTGGN